MKHGINLISCYQNAARQNLEEVNLRVEYVNANDSFKFRIPLKILENAVPNSLSGIECYEANFELRNWKDSIYGEKVTILFKVIEQLDEIDLYTKVMEIIEGQDSQSLEIPFGFDEVVEALKESSYDVKQAISILKAQREQGIISSPN